MPSPALMMAPNLDEVPLDAANHESSEIRGDKGEGVPPAVARDPSTKVKDSNSHEISSVRGRTDSRGGQPHHVVNVPAETDREECSGEVKGALPRDAGNPWTFIKGSTYLGRSIDQIRRRERSVVLPPPNEGEAFSDEIEATLTRAWEGKSWEEVPKRVENLLWIKKNTFYREVLDDCKEQKKEYDARIKASFKSQGEVTNEIYNLIGFFSVFQGVILTAVTQLAQTGSKPVCGKVWFPIALSVLAAIIAVGGIAFKYRQLHSHEKEIHRYRDYHTQLKRREDDLKAKGENFYFGGTQKERDQKKRVEETLRLLDPSWRIIKFILVSVLVSLVTAVFILSYIVIMCDKMVIKGWQ